MNCKENCRKKSNRNDKGEKMRKITDLRGIKDTAKVFLHMNIEETKFSPLVIKHPFTDSAMVCLRLTAKLPLPILWKIQRHLPYGKNKWKSRLILRKMCLGYTTS